VGESHSGEQEPAALGAGQWDRSDSKQQTVLVHSVTFLVTANSAQSPLVPRGFYFSSALGSGWLFPGLFSGQTRPDRTGKSLLRLKKTLRELKTSLEAGFCLQST